MKNTSVSNDTQEDASPRDFTFDKSCNLKSPLVRCRLMQQILRRWCKVLTPPEQSVVFMIFDRTIMWGKWNERITLRQFVEGVRERNGFSHHEGLCLTKKGVGFIIQRLVKSGCVLRFYTDGAAHYGINFEWPPTKLMPPKNRLPAVNTKATQRSRARLPTVGTKKDKERISPSEIKEEQVKPAQPVFVQSGIQKQRDRGEQFAMRLRLSNPTIHQIEKIWAAAWAATYPGAPRPSWRNNRERFALKQYGTRWSKANSIPFGEYLDWCVRNWGPIMGHYFKWMEAAPNLPMPFVLVKFSHVFEDIFSNRKEHEAFWRMPTREHMIEVKVRRGMSRQNATREVDEQLEVTNRLRELTTKQAQLQSAEEAFSNQKKELERQLARERAKNAIRSESSPKVANLRDIDQIDRTDFNIKPFGDYEQQHPAA